MIGLFALFVPRLFNNATNRLFQFTFFKCCVCHCARQLLCFLSLFLTRLNTHTHRRPFGWSVCFVTLPVMRCYLFWAIAYNLCARRCLFRVWVCVCCLLQFQSLCSTVYTANSIVNSLTVNRSSASLICMRCVLDTQWSMLFDFNLCDSPTLPFQYTHTSTYNQIADSMEPLSFVQTNLSFGFYLFG